MRPFANQTPGAATEKVTSIAVASVEESAAAALAWLPPESLVRLSHHVTPSAIRRRREAERNATYRALAGDLGPTIPTRELARTVAAELGRYRAGKWRFERDTP